MAKLSISKAAKEWGISRKTVQEAVKSGDLNTESGARNSKNVDTVDLLRIFGEPRTGHKSGETIGLGSSKVRSIHDGNDMTHKLISYLEVENNELKQKLKDDASFLQELVKNQTIKIADLEEELAEYRKPVKRLGWFRRS